MRSVLNFESEPAEHTIHEEASIQVWRTGQLLKLGLSCILTETVAGLVDWHEVGPSPTAE
jgi:hypothetical protein